MEIRPISTSSEKEDYFDLASFAFQIERSEERLRKVIEQTKDREFLGAFAGEKLISGLQIIPFETYLHKKRFKMGGLAGIATWPEFRRQGAVSKLLTSTLRKMRDNNQVFSFLFPFRYDFYYRYGWSAASDCAEFSTDIDNVPRGDIMGQVSRWDGNIEKLNKVYNKYAVNFNGSIVRTMHRWNNYILHKNRRVYVRKNSQGMTDGYLIFEVSDHTLKSFEFVSLNAEAQQDLWYFIANHDSMISKVNWKGPNDGLGNVFLVNPPFATHKIVARHMARIVDVQKLFENYPFPSSIEENFNLNINIKDEFAPWNHATWSIVVKNGNVQIEKAKTRSDSKQTLSVDIQTLSTLVIGHRSVKQMVYSRKLSGNEEQLKRLAKLFKKTTTYSTDWF